MTVRLFLITFSSLCVLSACGGSSDGSSSNPLPETVEFDAIETPITAPPSSNVSVAPGITQPGIPAYKFDSKYTSGDSVSYSGQVTRLIMLKDMISEIKSYNTQNAAIDVIKAMSLYMDGQTGDTENDANTGNTNFNFSIEGQTLLQSGTYDAISANKNFRSKIAGNDNSSHLIDGILRGWSEGMGSTPTAEELADYFIAELNSLVTSNSVPSIQTADGTANLDVAYVDAQGRDYSQLIEKFLLGAVAFSQGTADYLKRDFVNENTQNAANPYSIGEHHWDEAFGYFGAARDYDLYTDNAIAGQNNELPYFDTNLDNLIDLNSENNLSHATNCAKRDLGASVATNYTKQAFDAFLTGRKLLNDAGNASFNEGDITQIEIAAKQAAQVWEMCIASTVIHYINKTHADLATFAANGFFSNLNEYRNTAKHWSEMKGFALSLQFNPESPFHQNTDTKAIYDDILSTMGDRLDLSSQTAIANYRAELLRIRGLMQNAYGFAAANVENW